MAKGIELSALGRPASGVQRLDIPKPTVADEQIAGEVLRVDRFGNLVTNVDRRSFDRLTGGSAVDIRIGGHVVAKVVSTYADAVNGEVCALFGSTDHLEIAANGASAASLLALERGAPVTVTRRA